MNRHIPDGAKECELRSNTQHGAEITARLARRRSTERPTGAWPNVTIGGRVEYILKFLTFAKGAPFIPLIFILFTLAVAPLARAQMDEMKGKHFVVRYNTERDFAQKVLNEAEVQYERITRNLGYSRYDNYWTFQDRCTLLIYDSKENYLRSRKGIPAWSAGYAEYQTRTISGFRGSDKFLNTVLPHEITHLIFNDYVGNGKVIPKWFSEGVALSQEENIRKQFLEQVGKALHQHYFIPNYLLSDEAFKGVHNYDFTYLSYAEAGLLIDFLISNYGPEKFVQLCRELRDGKDLESAIQAAYRGSLNSIENLEVKFIEKFSVDGAY